MERLGGDDHYLFDVVAVGMSEGETCLADSQVALLAPLPSRYRPLQVLDCQAGLITDDCGRSGFAPEIGDRTVGGER